MRQRPAGNALLSTSCEIRPPHEIELENRTVGLRVRWPRVKEVSDANSPFEPTLSAKGTASGTLSGVRHPYAAPRLVLDGHDEAKSA